MGSGGWSGLLSRFDGRSGTAAVAAAAANLKKKKKMGRGKRKLKKNRNGQRTQIGIFSKKTYRWPTDI